MVATMDYDSTSTGCSPAKAWLCYRCHRDDDVVLQLWCTL